MKKVTIIIPVYNAENYLDKCIKSIVNQTYKNIEIILINDGSIDNSPNICDKWKEMDNRIKVIHKQNEGVSKARNIGIENATGDYIGFVDDDDYIDKNMYQEMVNLIETKETDIVACNFYNVEKEKKIGINKEVSKNWLNEVIAYDSIRGYIWNKLYKSDIIKHTKFNNEVKIGEDMLFNISLLNTKSISFSYIERPLYYYIQHKKSTMSTLNAEKIFSYLKELEKIINMLKGKKLECFNLEYEYIYFFTIIKCNWKYTNTFKDNKTMMRRNIQIFIHKDKLLKNIPLYKKCTCLIMIYCPLLFNILKKIKD